MWYDPGFREETEIDWVLILHLFKTHRKLTFLCHSTHRREMVHSLEAFKLIELFGLNRHIVPDYIDVALSSQFFFGELFLFFFCHLLLAVTFFSLLFVFWVIIILLFLGYDFPLHLECHLAEDFVFRVSQVNPNLASVENIATIGRRSLLALIRFFGRRLRRSLHLVGGGLLQLDDRFHLFATTVFVLHVLTGFVDGDGRGFLGGCCRCIRVGLFLTFAWLLLLRTEIHR